MITHVEPYTGMLWNLRYNVFTLSKTKTMQAEALKQYLAKKIQVVQDEGVLLALKTIIDQHLDQASNPYKAQIPNLNTHPTPPAPKKAVSDEVDQLAEELEEEKKEQEIEEWLKRF